MSINVKLGAIVCLFLVPILLLAWLFIDQSDKDIAFARREIDGASYLSAAWPLLKDLAGSRPVVPADDGRRLEQIPLRLHRSLQP